MSDAHSPIDEPHEGPIKTPKQLITAVVFAFVVPVLVIVLLAIYVSSDSRPAAGSNLMEREAIAARIQPIGQVQIKDASDVGTLKTGEQVFAAQCGACHTAGVAGAPKLGDATAWAPRIKLGYEVLLETNGSLDIWRDGTSTVALQREPVKDMGLDRGLLTIGLTNNKTKIVWKGQVFEH